MYLLPNNSKRKKIRRLFLNKRFFILTLILYHTYFGSKIEFFVVQSVFFFLNIKYASCQKMSY